MKRIYKNAKIIAGLSSMLKIAGLEDESEQATNLIKKEKDPLATLAIFDYDNTLFRSPLKPAVWKGGWWGNPASLQPPCLPQSVGEEYWIPDTVAAARRAISDPNTFSVCMTGRQDSIFRGIVPHLLSDVGLNFDMVKLSNSDNTLEFKLREILELLIKYPFISNVHLWDDKLPYLNNFKAAILSEHPDLKVEIHHVVAASMPALCEGSFQELPVAFPNKASYIGLMLESGSKSKLFEAFPTKHPEEAGDHVTVMFNPTGADLEAMRGLFGKKYQITVTGYAEDEKGQAVSVEAPGISFPAGKIPHITVSTAKGVSPVYSNELLAKGNIKKVDGPVLTGVLWWK